MVRRWDRRSRHPQQEIDLLGSVDLKTTAVAAPPTRRSPRSGRRADRRIRRSCAASRSRSTVPTTRNTNTRPRRVGRRIPEIFYDHGWTAYVDGEAMPGFRADYILRAMKLPAGRHRQWRFRAPGWAAAEAVTLVSSLLILLGAAAA
ncbi:MAG: hypothetical protein ACLRMJ_02555 [Alistipes finegoldii]